MYVDDGAIVLKQHPYGQGGLLLTDSTYGDFELYLELKPDWGTNGGVFFQSTESGSAYQIEVVGGGAAGTGNLFGEMLRVERGAQADGLQKVWKENDWNALRLRVVGEVPRVTLWVNGVRMYDAVAVRNDLTAGATGGMIGLQLHWSATETPVPDDFSMHRSWKPGAAHRYRTIAVRGLPEPEVLTSAFGMAFVRIEPGSMRVGRFEPECPSPPEEAPSQDERDPRARWTAEDYARCRKMARRDAHPDFTATIEEPFYIGRYEVTQDQWERVMGTNPSVFQGGRVEGDAGRHPVDSVTWEQAKAFVERLNALDTTAVYRLPTELEWEYAARAGLEGALPWAELRAQAWIQDVDKGSTHPVGQKAPNAWGLHDMMGNVWEWVQDYYNGKLFPGPAPPDTGEVHVLRVRSDAVLAGRVSRPPP